jgi:heptaprenyl diphosphate synthase
MDDADIRRGIPTLQNKYGKKTAVICGDYLLGKALQLAAAIDDRQAYLDIELPVYLSRISLGELEQHIHNGDLNLSVYRYLRIISGKTAALFEACFHGGAVLGGAGENERKLYRKLGRAVGMIFQLTDDCMDFEAEEGDARKPVQSDYEQGVITLPLIRALESSAELKARLCLQKAARREVNEAVERWDGLGFTRKVAKRYAGKAEELICGLDADCLKKEKLRLILRQGQRKAEPAR